MFRGSSQTRVDEKGRLKIPADFKRDLGENLEFYITSQDGKRAEIYPMSVWKKKEAKLAKAFPASSRVRQRVERTTSYYGATVEMDGQGRVLLPSPLRDDADLMAEVVVIARLGERNPENPEEETLGFLEVSNNEAMRLAMKADPITDEDLDALAAAGL
jgi:MraZ protein